MNVQDEAAAIVAREGGFVDNPNDPGGATNFGVTIGTMRRLGLDLTGDGKITVEDVKRLTRADATRIFVKQYFERPHIDRLPDEIQDDVFDMYVNAGANAVRILQRLVSSMGWPCTADGVIGPNTVQQVTAAAQGAAGYLGDAYAIARRNYYFRLADARPSLRVFARTRAGGKGGWITRAEGFMAPKYRMTDAQFQERVKAWA